VKFGPVIARRLRQRRPRPSDRWHLDEMVVRIAGGRLARRPHRPLRWLADRLADESGRLDELALGDLAVRPRLAVGYQRLDDAGRRLLRRLALLDGLEFSPWVAAALLDGATGQGEELLERLVEEQLVETAGRHSAGPLRYRMPDLVRAYARECADTEETAADADAARNRVLAGWLALTPVGPPPRTADRTDAAAARRAPRLSTARTAVPFGSGIRPRTAAVRPDLGGSCRPAV
jgi:hypothetical protein